MLYSPYRFQKIHPNLHPSRLLTDSEKQNILEIFNSSNANMHTISIDDWISIHFDAKIGDIICMKNNTTELYRLVIDRKLIK